jgi:hypothetical protein
MCAIFLSKAALKRRVQSSESSAARLFSDLQKYTNQMLPSRVCMQIRPYLDKINLQNNRPNLPLKFFGI